MNYEDGNPKTGSLRTVHGYAISAKRYALMEGAKIIEVKGHGLGYLMSPASSDEPDWMESAWRYILRLDQVLWDGADPPWLDYPAMMKIPISSPAVVLENVIGGEELTNQRHLYQSLVGVLGGQGHVTLLLERWRRPLKASRSFR